MALLSASLLTLTSRSSVRLKRRRHRTTVAARQFVLARLEKAGLSPSSEAPKEALIRRVTLDLIGLPPTPPEIDAFLADPTVLYGLYFPKGMKISLQGGVSCSSFCGYHSHFTYNGQLIKYAAFPYTDCRACSVTGKTVADILTIVTSHEIREAVSDSLGSAWYDAAGYEADDKCAWHNLYQMTNGGFWVQPEYSNGGTVSRSGFTATYPGPGCVVPNR